MTNKPYEDEATEQRGPVNKGPVRVIGWPLTVLLLIVVSTFSILSAHNLTEILGFILIVALSLRRHAQRWRFESGIFFLWFVSLFLPVDIAFRTAIASKVGFMPVITAVQSHVRLRELSADGKMENRDFVVYRRASEFTRVRWALLIAI